MNSQIKRNFSFAFIAQGISFLVSCVTNLILPKILGNSDFSYWQLFIFYATYIPCLAFGINDGVYLRYGGMTDKELDYGSVKNQFCVGISYQILIACVIGFVSCLLISDVKRKLIIILVLIYYIIYTSHNFIGYVFQAINKTDVYSKSIILNRGFYLLIQVLLLAAGYVNVFVFIPLYILAMGIALFYVVRCIHTHFRPYKINMKNGWQEAVISIRTGISLMISNICAMLVLGVGRQIVDVKWGLLAFGSVSFSLTLINFALTFISQVSMVLFPALRRLNEGELKEYYLKLTRSLFLLLPLLYVIYAPGKYILNLWLPNYSDSIGYLGVILPICFFDCKMNLIGNTFFKVLRKQTALLKINIITIILSSLWGIFSAFCLNNMNLVVVGMVISIMFRSVVSDIVLSRYISVDIKGYEVLDIILGVVFMVCASKLNVIENILLFGAAFIFRLPVIWRSICQKKS